MLHGADLAFHLSRGAAPDRRADRFDYRPAHAGGPACPRQPRCTSELAAAGRSSESACSRAVGSRTARRDKNERILASCASLSSDPKIAGLTQKLTASPERGQGEGGPVLLAVTMRNRFEEVVAQHRCKGQWCMLGFARGERQAHILEAKRQLEPGGRNR